MTETLVLCGYLDYLMPAELMITHVHILSLSIS